MLEAVGHVLYSRLHTLRTYRDIFLFKVLSGTGMATGFSGRNNVHSF